MSRTVLILSSSPRIGGNSDLLCDSLAAGVESVGNKAVKLHVAQMKIAPCRACEYCHENSDGVCVIRDDMDQIWAALDQADAVVFASPIYFFDCSAQLKLVIDRLYARYEQMQVENSALLLTCGAEEDVAESAMILYRKLAACCGFQDKGILCATDVWAAGEIQEKNVLQDAYNLGKIL